MGPGKLDIESERPRNKKTGRYTDLDAAGQSTTVIEIPDGHPLLPVLLRNGSIQMLPPEPETEAESGEDPG